MMLNYGINNETTKDMGPMPFLTYNPNIIGIRIMAEKNIPLVPVESQDIPLCKCGCGEPVTGKIAYIYGHRINKLKSIEPKKCACGCGEIVSPGSDYRVGHWRRGKPQTKEHIAKRIQTIIGRTYTPEHRKNLSISHMGQVTWMKGKHHTEESKQKNREAHLGMTHTEEAKRKISEFNKGKVLSDDHKRKIGKGNTGNVHSKEARLKNAIAHMKPRTDGYCDIWSDSSFRNDTRGSACQSCGLTNMANIHITGVKLSLHHTNGKKSCVPDDIQTLCSRCHTIADWRLRKGDPQWRTRK